MRVDRKVYVLILCLAVGAAACGSPPTGEVELAKGTLDKAVAAGAETFAPAMLKAAREAQSALDAEMKAQEGKWFKSYGKATDLAIAAQAAADKAAAEAVASKEETLATAAAGPSPDRQGPNLFANGSFSEGLQGWNAHPASDATISIDATPDGPAWHAQYRKGNWGVILQERHLRPGTVYVYEAKIKTTAPVVALYWQSETGRFHEIDKTYPEWTHLRHVFLTPAWDGKPYPTGFHPVLMKGPGEAWLKDVRLSEFKPQG